MSARTPYWESTPNTLRHEIELVALNNDWRLHGEPWSILDEWEYRRTYRKPGGGFATEYVRFSFTAANTLRSVTWALVLGGTTRRTNTNKRRWLLNRLAAPKGME